MTEQVFIANLPVSATIETDEQGVSCIRMNSREVDVRLWARVARSAGFRVAYQYMSGRHRLDCVCIDSGGNYRGIYSKDFCTVWLGKSDLFE